MRNFPSRRQRIAFGAAGAILLLSAGNSSAQFFYPRYDRYDRFDRYERSRRYDPAYDDYYGRRPMPRRDVGRDLDDDDFPARRARKPKHREAEQVKEEEPGKPARGPYQLIVSIASQRIYLYGADGLIRESRVSTGMRGHSTPTGVFSVIEKDYYHESNIYSGAPMPLMQRLTWSGVALHEGVLPGYPASHGCIRLNGEFAKFLWYTTEKGARVIVARSDVDAPAPIESAKLFIPIIKPIEIVGKASSIARNTVNESATPAPTAMPADPAADQPEHASEPVAAAGASESINYKVPPLPARKGQIAAFISRKTGKLHVRYGFEPLFETPVEIKDRDKPIGTHVLTAIEPSSDGKTMKWTSVSIPAHPATAETEQKKPSRKVADIADQPAPADTGTGTAIEALDRIEIPAEAAQKIGELLSPGASLTISDYGVSDETGDGTDFIVLTR